MKVDKICNRIESEITKLKLCTNAKVVVCYDPNIKKKNTVVCALNKSFVKNINMEVSQEDDELNIYYTSPLFTLNHELRITTNTSLELLSINSKGSIYVSNINATELSLNSTEGSIIIEKTNCSSLYTHADKGFVDIKNVMSSKGHIFKTCKEEIGKIAITNYRGENLEVNSNCAIDMNDINVDFLCTRAYTKPLTINNITADKLNIFTIKAPANINKVSSKIINIDSFEDGDVNISKYGDIESPDTCIKIDNGKGRINLKEVRVHRLALPHGKTANLNDVQIIGEKELVKELVI